MEGIEKLDNELYGATYGHPRVGDYEEIWAKIKSNPEILREAVKIKRNKWDNGDTVKGVVISDVMLVDYENVDPVAYKELINSIYTNTDIARIVIDGASNGGFSFLLMSLWNHNLELTEEQKSFAVNEAMNKSGTTRWKQQREAFSNKLDSMGINNDTTTFINIGGCINPIGQKACSEYMNNKFASLSSTQAHGTEEFDIRYWILRNPNWTIEEKQKLIMDFWYDAEDYDETLEQWEWGIINDDVNYKEDSFSFLDKVELYYYDYDELLKFYGDKETTDRIWEEIQFCRQMHKLRPQQWELEFMPKKKVLA